MFDLPIEPPEDRDPAHGYAWSLKDDEYWELKRDSLADEEMEK